MGDTSPESCREVKCTPSINFMNHNMIGFQWYHQSDSDIERTIRGLQGILSSKRTLKSMITKQLSEFDWTHMYSDDHRVTPRQEERNKKFNELVKECPYDLKIFAYIAFIKEYMNCSPSPMSPISYDKFIKGVDV